MQLAEQSHFKNYRIFSSFVSLNLRTISQNLWIKTGRSLYFGFFAADRFINTRPFSHWECPEYTKFHKLDMQLVLQLFLCPNPHRCWINESQSIYVADAECIYQHRSIARKTNQNLTLKSGWPGAKFFFFCILIAINDGKAPRSFF